MQEGILITLPAGGSVVRPHSSKAQNGVSIVPAIIYPDRNSPIGVLSCDLEQIVFVNPSLGEAQAFFYIQVLGGGPYILHWRGAIADQVAQGSYIEVNGQTNVAGSITPVDVVIPVYVQPDYGASGAWLGPGAPTYGSDTNPGTKNLPFRTTTGVVQRFGRRGIQGAQILGVIGGYSVRPPGGWPVTPAANDPWDGYADQDRVCFTREIEFQGSDAFRAGYSWVGPRKMFRLGAVPPLAFVNASQIGQRVRLNFGAPTGLGQGQFIAMRRTDDDRDVYFPHVISEVAAGGTQVFVEAPFTAADWMADYAASGAYMVGVVPTVQVSGDPDYESGGVNVHGFGGGHIGDGRTGGAPDTRNPIPHLAYLMIIRGAYNVVGQWLACTVWFDDGSEFMAGSEPILKGCSGGPNGYVRWKADGRKLNADSNYLPNTECTGWALVSALPGPPPPNADPEVQTGGPGELVIGGDCNLVLGDALGTRGGRMRIIHGLAVICSTGRIPVEVRGKDACLWVSGDPARPAFLTLVTPGNVPCLWAIAGAEVYTNSGQMQLTNSGGSGTLRVGKGAAINAGVGAGEYLEPAPGYEGNFTRRLELNAALGQAADDDSRICDDTWMPADYSGPT